jgi:LysM repeat protein
MVTREDSSKLPPRVDTFKVRFFLKLPVVWFLALPLGIFANPFAKYEEELNQLSGRVGGSSGSLFFSGIEGKIQRIFRQGIFQPQEESEEIDTLDELPKYLKFSTIISSRIIQEKGEVIKKHTVKPKDTLLAIARTYGTDLAKIKAKNGLKTDLIRVGDILEVPVVTGNASRKKVVTKRIFINPVPEGRVSSRYGRRKDPFNKYSRNFHSGLDMAAAVGTPVVASADGEVIFTGKNGGYGNTVMILHANGYKTVYAHCSKILVEVGEKVKMGRVIAAVGRTGTATGAHLHFEVHRNGKVIDPEVALNTFEKIVTKLGSANLAGL